MASSLAILTISESDGCEGQILPSKAAVVTDVAHSGTEMRFSENLAASVTFDFT